MIVNNIRCLSRSLLNDTWLWMYATQSYVLCYTGTQNPKRVQSHRVPFFLSIHSHLTLEEKIEDFWMLARLNRFNPKKLLFIYDVLHGLVCGYTMQEIITFWKRRRCG